MGWATYCGGFVPLQRLKFSTVKALDASKSVVLRLNVLERVDEELVKGDERTALSLVKDLQGKPKGLRCFGAASYAGWLMDAPKDLIEPRNPIPSDMQQIKFLPGSPEVPQRLYTLDELKLNGIDTISLLSPVDATLGQIERNLQLAAVFGGLSAWVGFGLNQLQVLFLSLGMLFLWTADQVSFGGGVGSLFIDTVGHAVSQKYHNRVIQHEAGHFLIAYLLGVLPRGYALSSLEALRKEGSLNVQAGTSFVDFEFLEEVNAGKVSAKTLNQFSCIALAGVATEYLLFGCSEGGLGDINQLDGLLKSLGFTQKKADSQVRWAVLNTILILRRHKGARSTLAEAMASGRSVGFCIDTIEKAIDGEDV